MQSMRNSHANFVMDRTDRQKKKPIGLPHMERHNNYIQCSKIKSAYVEIKGTNKCTLK